MRRAKNVLAVVMMCSVVSAPAVLPAGVMAQSAGSADGQVQADVTKALSNKRLKEVTAKVQDGVVTLSGQVPTFSDKQDAGKKAQKVKNVSKVDNQIQVAGGPEVSDQELGQKLIGKVSSDRIGYGTTTFNAITVNVQNGVVTLGGVAYSPTDKSSALGLVSSYPGVKDVVDKIQVAPTSPNDDRIRRDVARAIYGYPTFTKYGINPVKPIRIVVINGNVTLVGSVDNKSDADTAALRANGVGGVFKVTNDLNYPGQQGTER